MSNLAPHIFSHISLKIVLNVERYHRGYSREISTALHKNTQNITAGPVYRRVHSMSNKKIKPQHTTAWKLKILKWIDKKGSHKQDRFLRRELTAHWGTQIKAPEKKANPQNKPNVTHKKYQHVRGGKACR